MGKLSRAQVNEVEDLELPKPHQNPDVSAQLFPFPNLET